MGNLWKIPVTWKFAGKLKVSINFWKARAIDVLFIRRIFLTFVFLRSRK